MELRTAIGRDAQRGQLRGAQSISMAAVALEHPELVLLSLGRSVVEMEGAVGTVGTAVP